MALHKRDPKPLPQSRATAVQQTVPARKVLRSRQPTSFTSGGLEIVAHMKTKFAPERVKVLCMKTRRFLELCRQSLQSTISIERDKQLNSIPGEPQPPGSVEGLCYCQTRRERTFRKRRKASAQPNLLKKHDRPLKERVDYTTCMYEKRPKRGMHTNFTIMFHPRGYTETYST